jgi:mono/diheme cytochrome c family protein
VKAGYFALAIFLCGLWLLCGAIAFIFASEPANTGNGRTLYFQYCAGCHGNDASGNGSTAAKMKAHPPSLKNLKGSDGKFPLLKVQNVIKGDANASKHSAGVMPVWGKYFQEIKDKSSADLNINALAKYLESFQPE